MSVCQSIQSELKVYAEEGGVELVERLAPQWLALCIEASNNEPFYRPEWVAAYLRAFAPSAELLLLSAHVGERMAGVLPLEQQRGSHCGFPVRKLRGTANVHSCRFDLLRTAGPEGDSAVKAIWARLRERENWDVIELPDVPEGGAGRLLLEEARKDRFPTGEWDSFRSPFIPLANLKGSGATIGSARFRRNLRRRLSKAQEQYGVSLRRCAVADPDDLQRFFYLEGAGWKGREGTAVKCSAPTRRFYDEIARCGERFGYLSLYLLHFGERLAAAHFGLTYEGRYYSPKVAYSEEHAGLGPGHLIVDAILRDCVERNLREFDFLGPTMDWKSEWTSEARAHSHCYVFRPGLFGQMLYMAKFRAQTALRGVGRALITRPR